MATERSTNGNNEKHDPPTNAPNTPIAPSHADVARVQNQIIGLIGDWTSEAQRRLLHSCAVMLGVEAQQRSAPPAARSSNTQQGNQQRSSNNNTNNNQRRG